MKIEMPGKPPVTCSNETEAYDVIKEAVMPIGSDRDFRLVLSSVVGVSLQGLSKEDTVDVLISSGYVRVARAENA